MTLFSETLVNQIWSHINPNLQTNSVLEYVHDFARNLEETLQHEAARARKTVRHAPWADEDVQYIAGQINSRYRSEPVPIILQDVLRKYHGEYQLYFRKAQVLVDRDDYRHMLHSFPYMPQQLPERPQVILERRRDAVDCSTYTLTRPRQQPPS